MSRIVLLHAGVCDARAWEGVARILREGGHEVVAYTRAGGSPLQELLGVLDGRPAWLVGSSMGGAVALDAALAEPGLVQGLVLIAPAVSGMPELPEEEYDPDSVRIWQGIESANDDAERARLVAHLWLDGPQSPEGRVAGPVRELVVDQGDDDFDDGIDAWSRLEEVRAPAVVTWGDLDAPDIVDAARTVARRLADVRGTHVFAGTAHLPYLERPEEVASVIAAACR
jgi:pimeloyl-ACP methyl ester carboxylesterase